MNLYALLVHIFFLFSFLLYFLEKMYRAELVLLNFSFCSNSSLSFFIYPRKSNKSFSLVTLFSYLRSDFFLPFFRSSFFQSDCLVNLCFHSHDKKTQISLTAHYFPLFRLIEKIVASLFPFSKSCLVLLPLHPGDYGLWWSQEHIYGF